jgi:hypothetical protein
LDKLLLGGDEIGIAGCVALFERRYVRCGSSNITIKLFQTRVANRRLGSNVVNSRQALWIGWAGATLAGLVVMAITVANYYMNKV